MKIGMVCYPTVGGSGVVATELGHALAKRGHEVHFITYDVPFRLQINESNIFFHEVEITQYELFKYPDYALALAVKMANVAKQYKLDVLHVHYAIPHATSAFLAKQLLDKQKIAVLTTLHGTDITLVGRDPAYFQIIKFSIEKSDGITAVSEALKMQTCKHFDICNEVDVIYNFFVPQTEYMGKKPLRDLFVKGKQKLLLHSSNYRSVKRPEDVVRIFALVRKQIDCRLMLLGTGSGLDEIQRMVYEQGLQDDVIFVGKSRNVDPYIASADLFLLPSAQESFGLAALEAMAYGLPVVATRVGGLPELIEEGKSGLLAPIGAVEKMAEHAIYLLSNEDVYASFSEAARRRAAEKFSAEKIVPQYEACYSKIQNGRA